MTGWVALLRGINVGGRNTLPMAELKAILAALDCRDVHTVLQSGNACFGHASKSANRLAAQIADGIETARGFRPHVLLLESAEFRHALDACPYADTGPGADATYLYFLETRPAKPDVGRLDALRAGTERWTLTDRTFYLYAPGGVGRSRLAQGAERALGVAATARNWRTARRVAAIAQPG